VRSWHRHLSFIPNILQEGTSMGNATDATLVVEVARDLVSQIAPQELPLFSAASAAYYENPEAALKNIRSRDDFLGFGVDSLGALLTPVVLVVLSEVIGFLIDVAKKATEDGLAKEIPELVRAMFKRFRTSERDQPPVLTGEQVGLVPRKVLLAAKRLRLTSDQAQSLANAVTAQLVLPPESS
jgi:hypothetical protein